MIVLLYYYILGIQVAVMVVVKAFSYKNIKKLSLEDARKRKPKFNWKNHVVNKPKHEGIKIFKDYPLNELVNYIDWSPFFHAWEMKGTYPKILKNSRYGIEAQKVFEDGSRILGKIVSFFFCLPFLLTNIQSNSVTRQHPILE